MTNYYNLSLFNYLVSFPIFHCNSFRNSCSIVISNSMNCDEKIKNKKFSKKILIIKKTKPQFFFIFDLTIQ